MKSISGTVITISILLLLLYVSMSWNFAREEEHMQCCDSKVNQCAATRYVSHSTNGSNTALPFAKHTH